MTGIFSGSHRNLAIAGGLSLVMLIGLMLLQQFGATAMTLKAHWIAVAALPIIVALFAGNYITKVDAFGVSFERAIQKPAQPEKLDDPAALSVEGDSEKGSPRALRSLGDADKLKKRQLKFRAGTTGQYTAMAIAQYMKELPLLETLLVLGPNNAFMGRLDVAALRSPSGAPSTPPIKEFIKLLGQADTAGFSNAFGENFSTLSMSTDSTVGEAFAFCQSNDLSSVPAVGSDGTYQGVFQRETLANEIANKALRARES